MPLTGDYIQQLDTQMHKMMQEKHRRSEEVKADQAAVNKIEETMQVHIQPCLVRTWVHGLQHELCFTTATFCVVDAADLMSLPFTGRLVITLYASMARCLRAAYPVRLPMQDWNHLIAKGVPPV